MAGKKKPAKMGHHKVKDEAEQIASHIAMVAGTHRVSKNVTGRTDCGRRLNEGEVPRWRYGHERDVKCQYCLERVHYTTVLEPEVPPVFPEEWYADGFEVDGHRANDGDDVPIMCYECGENWPCRTVVSTLPVLDMEAFEEATT